MSVSEFSVVNSDLCLPAIVMSGFLMQSFHKAFKTRILLFLLETVMYTTVDVIITAVFNKYNFTKRNTSPCQINCQCI